MKTRLLAVLLTAVLALGVLPATGAEEITPLQAGQMAIFPDCVITLHEVAWYGRVEGNVLLPAQNGAPSFFTVRLQVINRNISYRDFALDSAMTVRYGSGGYAQPGVVVEEAGLDADGLRFVRDASVLVGPLQAKNLVAYAAVSPLMYYSPEGLTVDLTIGGHALSVPVGAAAIPAMDPYTVQPPVGWQPTPAPTALPSGPVVVNPPTAQPGSVIQITQQTQVGDIQLSAAVRYVDENGLTIQDPTFVTVAIGGMAAFTPPDIPGYAYDHYSFMSGGRRQNGYGMGIAVYASSAGVLDKQEIYLHYNAVAPQPSYQNSRAVPTGKWDTQFKPGVATAPDGRGDNANVYLRLDNLHDDNAGTSLSWLLYVSDRTDGIPEFTVNMNGATVSAIGIRNGRVTSEQDYFRFARLASLRLRVHTNGGETFNTWVYLPDEYHPEYQVLPLGKTYTDVASIELWLEGNVDQGFYMGQGEYAYTIHVTDIQFYAGEPSPATAAPAQGSGYSY